MLDRLVTLIGDDFAVPCVDGQERPYLNLDNAASTNALPAVARRVQEFLPWYSSVHRGQHIQFEQAEHVSREHSGAPTRLS